MSSNLYAEVNERRVSRGLAPVPEEMLKKYVETVVELTDRILDATPRIDDIVQLLERNVSVMELEGYLKEEKLRQEAERREG